MGGRRESLIGWNRRNSRRTAFQRSPRYWSVTNCSFYSQPTKQREYLYFILLAFITMASIRAIDSGRKEASGLWILYQVYILFDHLPFPFTVKLYASPRFNYKYVSLLFFWGLEGVSAIVATRSQVRAPWILLYNCVPHSAFIYSNYGRSTPTAAAFVGDRKWYITCQVLIDNCIHIASLWYHIRFCLSDVEVFPEVGGYQISRNQANVAIWSMVFLLAILLTWKVHGHQMKWAYFVKHTFPCFHKEPRVDNAMNRSGALHSGTQAIQFVCPSEAFPIDFAKNPPSGNRTFKNRLIQGGGGSRPAKLSTSKNLAPVGLPKGVEKAQVAFQGRCQ